MNTMHVIPTRHELPATTAMRLGEADLVALDVQPGDRLRSDCGTLWITVDGESRDVLIGAGEVHRIEAAGRVNVSALRSAHLVVLGQAPLRWRRVGAGGRGFAERLQDAFRALSSRPAWH